jgi:hypothetical protein
MSPKLKAWLGAAAVFLLLGIVGRMDYVDALEQENADLKIKNAQCRRVKIGMTDGWK